MYMIFTFLNFKWKRLLPAGLQKQSMDSILVYTVNSFMSSKTFITSLFYFSLVLFKKELMYNVTDHLRT